VRTSPQDLDHLRRSYLRNAADRLPVEQWTAADVAFLAADLKSTEDWVRANLPGTGAQAEPTPSPTEATR
jgi:hypothetical protein